MSFTRSSLDVITLSGTTTDVAFALGKARRKQIEARIEHWNETLARLFNGQRARLKSLEKEFLSAGERAAPEFVAEIRAMAKGADVAFADLFRVNLTELKPYAEKCTTAILPISQRGRKKILIAHNEDWEPSQNDVFVLRAKLPDVSYAILTYDGYLPGLSTGFNSHGLYHAVNYVLAKDIRAGVPRSFITRFLVTARSTKECLDWIRKTPRAFGQSIHLAQDGRYTGIELTAKRVIVRGVKPPTLHANHYLTPSLKNIAAAPSANSLVRQKIGAALVKKFCLAMPTAGFSPSRAKTIATKILSDRSGLPYAIWREADSPLESSATVASAFLMTGDEKMAVYRNRPDKALPLIVALPE